MQRPSYLLPGVNIGGLNAITSSLQTLQDGQGNALPFQISTKTVAVVNGTLTDGINAFSVTSTQPTTITASQSAILFNVTSAGSSSFANYALQLNYIAGYTGSSSTYGAYINNTVLGTANTLIPASGSNATLGNFGINANSSGTVAGLNIGFLGTGSGGDVSVGVGGISQVLKNSGVNIGVVGSAINTGTSPVQIGGWFSLNQTTNPTVSAALVADNAAQTSSILLLRDGGVTVFDVADGGAMTQTKAGQTSNTVTAGISYINSTAATSGNQQYSPYALDQGNGYASTSGTSRATAFRRQVIPVQGTSNPSAYWIIESSINGGAFGGSMCLTSAGNLGVGTTTPSGIIHAAQAAAGANIVLTESSDTGVMPASFVSQRSRGTSLTSPTAIQTGNGLGGWIIQGYNGTAYVTCAQINGVAAQTFTGSVNGAHIVFQTTTNGLTAINEKMRLTDAGNLGIGLTTVPGYLSIKAGTSTVPPVLLTNSSTTLVASPTVGMMEYTNIGGNNLLTFVRTGTTREVMVTGKITAGTYLTPITNKVLVFIGDDGTSYNLQLVNP